MTDKIERTEEVAIEIVEAINKMIINMPDPENDRLPIFLVALSVAVGSVILRAATVNGRDQVAEDFIHNIQAVLAANSTMDEDTQLQ